MKVSTVFLELISLILVAVGWLAMTPIIIDQVQAINTTGWTFTGYEGAIALLGLVPFAWIGAGLAMLVVGMFGLVRYGKGNKE